MSTVTLVWAAVAATSTATLVDVTALDPRWRLDIRYATADNFVGEPVYPEARCLLRPQAADKLEKAQAWLDRHRPGHVLLFKDCYRPHSAQHRLWAAVVGTPKARYVANPNTRTGSIHSYGAAVDLTLMHRGKEVDMGTAYDHLGKLAEPRHEERFLAAGRLRPSQVKNRRILRRAMRAGGFSGIRNEWWHFNAVSARTARTTLPRLDIPFASVPQSSFRNTRSGSSEARDGGGAPVRR